MKTQEGSAKAIGAGRSKSAASCSPGSSPTPNPNEIICLHTDGDGWARPRKSQNKPLPTQESGLNQFDMGYVICGARNKHGMPCGDIAVTGSKRCRHHGGLSTGPRSAVGRAFAGARLAKYRINGTGRKPTHKWRDHKLAMIKRRQKVDASQEQRRARHEHKRRMKLIAAGIQLVPDPSTSSVAD